MLNGRVRSRALGQNFLRNRRTARRVAHLAGEDHSLLCVDVGAGNGAITEACLLRSGPILAIEVDSRLAQQLRNRFAGEPRVTILEEDLSISVPPAEPFVVAANPPFNLSTLLVRRWFAHPNFHSGALIVEKPFAGRVSGSYGATKVSISLAPYLELKIPFDVRPAEFSPQPSVDAAILTAARRADPALPWADRASYWMFVNYLFERGRHTVGEALRELKLVGVPESVLRLRVREIESEDAIELHYAVQAGSPRVRDLIGTFEESLPPARRAAIGDLPSINSPVSGRPEGITAAGEMHPTAPQRRPAGLPAAGRRGRPAAQGIAGRSHEHASESAQRPRQSGRTRR